MSRMQPADKEAGSVLNAAICPDPSDQPCKQNQKVLSILSGLCLVCFQDLSEEALGAVFQSDMFMGVSWRQTMSSLGGIMKYGSCLLQENEAEPYLM